MKNVDHKHLIFHGLALVQKFWVPTGLYTNEQMFQQNQYASQPYVPITLQTHFKSFHKEKKKLLRAVMTNSVG